MQEHDHPADGAATPGGDATGAAQHATAYATSTTSRTPLTATMAATAIAALLLFSTLAAIPAITTRTPFFTKGEPREALVVQAIVRGEGIVLPLRNGDEIPSKPPLFHWLGALSSLATGRLTEGTIRAPGLAASVLTVAATAACAWRWWGPATGAMAALLLATSFQWSASSTVARVDMVLAACVSLALLGFGAALLPRRAGGGGAGPEASNAAGIPALAFALLAAATLTKGPVGFVLPVAVAGLTLAALGEWRRVGLREAKLLAAALAVAGLWYAAAMAGAGDAFVAKQVLKENVFRVLDPDSVDAGHVRPFWYYLPLLLAGFAPWSLFLPGLLLGLASRRDRASEAKATSVPEESDATADTAEPATPAPASAATPTRDPALVFAAVWAGVTFALFSAAGSKRSVYLLPAYPAFAMLAARAFVLVEERGDGAHGGAARALRLGASAVALVLGAAAALLLLAASGLPLAAMLSGLVSETDARNLPALLEAVAEHRLLVIACSLVVAGAAAATWREAAGGRWLRTAAMTAVALLAFSATVSTTLLPALAERRSPRRFLARVESIVPASAALSFYRAFDYGAVFYRGAPIPQRSTLADVPEIDGAWLLTWPSLLPALAEEVGKLDTGSGSAGAYEVEEALASEDVDPSDHASLVLVRIVRRIGDERSDGKRDPRSRRDPVPARDR